MPCPTGRVPKLASRLSRLTQRIYDQAVDHVSTGILTLGFDVIERRHIEPVFADLGFQHEDWVNPATRHRFAERLGLLGAPSCGRQLARPVHPMLAAIYRKAC